MSEVNEPAVVAIDLGATSIKGIVVDRAGRRAAEQQVPTDRTHGPDAVLSRLVGTVVGLLDTANAAGLAPSAIGVAVCGVVDLARLSATSVNLAWEDVEVGRALTEKTGLPVTLLNDAQAGALGEGHLGAAKDCENFLYVALGTGIGAAIVQGGRLVSGAHEHAGELGHVRISRSGPTCACGAVGCLETWMSARALQSRFAAATDAPSAPGPPSAERIVELAVSGHPVAAAVWSDAIDALAFGLLNASTLVDPGAIVIGGGIAAAGAVLFDPLRERFLKSASDFQILPELLRAGLGPWSGCAGTALAAWDDYGERRP